MTSSMHHGSGRDPARDADDYRSLADEVRRAGLLEQRTAYYVAKIASSLGLFFAGWALFFYVGDSWLTLPVGVLLAFLSVQVVFLGHDAGHQQIASTRGSNRTIGLLVGNGLTGLSFGWWVPKHMAHHTSPNVIGRDPDIGGGLIAFAPTAESDLTSSALIRFRARCQSWLFVVLLLLQGVGLRISGIQSVLSRRDRDATIERSLLIANTLVVLGTVFWVLSPVKGIVFLAVEQGLFGLYLGLTFAPNHKGMPVFEADDVVPFIERQVTTARNIKGGRAMTFIFGGLNLQIEHHLFPSMPRSNLARTKPFVEAFCVRNGIPYAEERVLDSYRMAVRFLQSAELVGHDSTVDETISVDHG